MPIQESDVRSVLETSGSKLPFELAEMISTIPEPPKPSLSQIFDPGMIILTELRKKACIIEEFIGGGRKGEVYRTKMDTSPVALKWYFPELANFEREEALRLLIDIGSPSNTFLWPVDIAKSDDVDGFGYIMPLKDTRLSSIADLLQQKIEPPVRCLATAGLNLTRGYKELHDKSLCYQDISPDDVLFDSKLGEIYICNNDNIQIDDQQIGEGVSLGFVAPEVVRGEAKPGSQSDLFSLAVLLFCIFVRHHPFEGERFEIEHLDHPEKVRLYGTEPVFIFDPVNDSNRCVGAKEFWYRYPEFLRELFTKSFTSGVSDPQNARLLETEWCTAMVRLRDSIILCNECQSENYYDLKTLKTKKHPGACQACRKDIGLPPRLRVGKEVTMLYLNTEIYPYHVSGQTTYDFSKPSAKVVPHHTKPGILGLKNLTENKWVRFRNNNPEDVEPGRSVTIDAGTTIDFGQVKGEIRTDPFGKV
jgi:serine/threonine protein kinase